MQGLKLDAAGGVDAPGTWLSREEEIRRQRVWAEQTDTRIAGVAEQMTIARDNVAHTAGSKQCRWHLRRIACMMSISCNKVLKSCRSM
jgi:rRNA maturation endonuclease Nob1